MMRKFASALAMLSTAGWAAPQFSVADISVSEGGGNATVTITKAFKASSYSKLTLTTGIAGDTAQPATDYQAVSVPLTFGNNELVKTVQIPLVNDATVEQTEAFTVKLTANRNAYLLKPTAKVTITDDDAQTPAPLPITGYPSIADNFTYSAGIEPTTYGPDGGPGIPPIHASNDLGAFRFECLPGQLLRDDPIQFPNQPGASHWHQFIGNTGANAFSTYDSLRTTGGSTCDNQGQPWAINRSSYWMPAMKVGPDKAKLPDHVLVYYKRFPKYGPGCVGPMAIGICTDLPNGLKFIFGYNMKTGTGGPTGEGTRDYWSMSYTCLANEAGTIKPAQEGINYHTIEDVRAAGCPTGARLHIHMDAPECWNGQVEAADHRSNMVYAPDGTDKGMGYVCPADHPYVIPLISYLWYFTVDEAFQQGLWHLASDEMVAGAKAGTTLHMDYDEGWSPKAKATWQATCINGPMSCSSGDMGDGTAIKGMGVLPYPYPSGNTVVLPN